MLRWEHTLQDQISAGHDPEPVRAADTGGEVVGRCDFCNSPGPEWVYPCASFSLDTSGFVGDWAACTKCHNDIEADRWDPIVRRNVRSATGHHVAVAMIRVAVEARVRLLFEEFEKYRSGPAVPLHERRR
jgi:hypothetical protein